VPSCSKRPVIHHPHVIGQHQRLGLIVRDVDEGSAEREPAAASTRFSCARAASDRAPQAAHRAAAGGFEHQTARDGDALTLSAREFIDALAAGAGKPHPLEHRRAAAQPLGASHAAPRQAEGHVLADDIIGNSARCWNTMLTGRRFGATPAMLLPPMAISPPSGCDETGDHAQQRGLAAARGPEDREEAAAGDAEGKTASTAVCAAKRLTTALATRSALLNWQP
jgi:hypothetical protein